MACTEFELVYGETKTVEGLEVTLYSHPEANFAQVTCHAPCISGGVTNTYNLGTQREVPCDDPSEGYWKITYYRYIATDIVRLIICKEEGTTPPIPCYQHTSQSACESAGCYWYDNACHSYPDQPDNEDLTDYNRIQSDVSDVVEPVAYQVSVIDSLVRGVSNLVSSVEDTLTSQIGGVLSGVTGLIDTLDTKLLGLIDDLSESLIVGLNDIADQITSIEFPTIDSIKEAFLDVCADLATALWDTILDKIEERYPDDDKE